MGKILMIMMCPLLMVACRSTKEITEVLPPAAIDSLGKVTVQHTREISYIPDGDTLIHRGHIPLPDYQDSTITIKDGRMTVRLPRPPQKIIKEQTTVEIPIYKENMNRVRKMQQKNDSLQTKNQQVTGQLSRLTTYKVIVWTIAGCLVGILILVVLMMWLKGKLGWIGSGVKNIFGWITRLFSNKK